MRKLESEQVEKRVPGMKLSAPSHGVSKVIPTPLVGLRNLNLHPSASQAEATPTGNPTTNEIEMPDIAPYVYNLISPREISPRYLLNLTPVLTLRAHAGLRACEVKRMKESDIYWDKKLIDIRGEVAKRQSPDRPLPRKLEDLPETVWPWLNSVGGSEARIDTCNLYKRMKAVLEEADVSYRRNCLRHCFCSYAYSLMGDDGVVRKWSGHRKEKTFYDYYVNVNLTSKAEAIEYFALTPAANHVARLGNRHKRHQPTVKWPTTERFSELIAQMSNVKIGKMLNCTEAAVRKERKKRGI